MDGVIFDVDGTLWDSREIVAQSWGSVVRRETERQTPLSVSEITHLFGQTMDCFAAELFPEESQERQRELLDACSRAELEMLKSRALQPYDGIKEVFQILSREYPLFIVSNCQAGYIEILLQNAGLAPLVTKHYCPDDTGEKKAANISRLVRDYHLKDAVYIGDTQDDFQAAREAGVSFIYASYGFGTVRDANLVIKEPLDLLLMIR